MHRLLFVDDEPRVLDSLRRQLFSRRSEWEFHYATSGTAALDTLARAEFDVVITDIRMPGMDGASLLEEVRDRHPATIRIVLSGHCDSAAAARALSIAHRYLSKPCDAGTMRQTLERALELRAALDDPKLRSLLNRAGDLPHPPEVCAELEKALADAEPSFDRIGEIVARDPALVARVMQFANSAYFARSEPTRGIDCAIARLGTTVLKSLVVSTMLRDRFHPTRAVAGFDVRDEQRHAMLAAAIARDLTRSLGFCDQAFTSALLHDVGKLVLAARMPDEYSHALSESARLKLPLSQVEQDLLGATHAAVGAYLLALWGLPTELIDAVRQHHDPVPSLATPLDLTGSVIVANHLATEIVGGAPLPSPVADARWEKWRALAEDTRRSM